MQIWKLGFIIIQLDIYKSKIIIQSPVSTGPKQTLGMDDPDFSNLPSTAAKHVQKLNKSTPKVCPKPTHPRWVVDGVWIELVIQKQLQIDCL